MPREIPRKRWRAIRVRINLSEPDDIAYWSKLFGCTATELEEAVQNVGAFDPELVHRFITRRKTMGSGD